jgi:hypothetical protein
MNLRQIKNEGMKLGLEKELKIQQGHVEDKITSGQYALALQAAKIVVELLQELLKVTRGRTPRTTGLSKDEPFAKARERELANAAERKTK